MHASSPSIERKGAAAALIAAVASFMPTLQSQAAPSPAEDLLRLDRPLVIAHRGFSAIAPENTVTAFEFANAAGADLVELDYYHSKEGIPMVFHDSDLDRTTDARAVWGKAEVPIDQCTADQLRTLDVGSWFDSRYRGEQMPTLDEALTVIQEGSLTLIERKAGDAATCVELLKKRELVNQVIVQAFDWDYLADFHQLEPKQVLGALGPPKSRNGRRLSDEEKTLDKEWLEEARKTGAAVVGWNRLVTRESFKEAHRLGLKVWIYTVNDPNDAERLLDAGVDGIITDNPALIWRTLALRAGTR